MLHVRRALAAARARSVRRRRHPVALLIDPYFIPSGTPVFRQLAVLPGEPQARRPGGRRVRRGARAGHPRGHHRGDHRRVHHQAPRMSESGALGWNADGETTTDGRAVLRDLNRRLGTRFPLDGPKTLSGWMLEILRELPDGPVCVRLDGAVIEALSTDERTIRSFRLHRLTPADAPVAGGPSPRGWRWRPAGRRRRHREIPCRPITGRTPWSGSPSVAPPAIRRCPIAPPMTSTLPFGWHPLIRPVLVELPAADFGKALIRTCPGGHPFCPSQPRHRRSPTRPPRSSCPALRGRLCSIRCWRRTKALEIQQKISTPTSASSTSWSRRSKIARRARDREVPRRDLRPAVYGRRRARYGGSADRTHRPQTDGGNPDGAAGQARQPPQRAVVGPDRPCRARPGQVPATGDGRPDRRRARQAAEAAREARPERRRQALGHGRRRARHRHDQRRAATPSSRTASESTTRRSSSSCRRC